MRGRYLASFPIVSAADTDSSCPGRRLHSGGNYALIAAAPRLEDRRYMCSGSRDALLDLRHAPIHLGAREVLVAVVHRLELAAVDRHAGLREQAHRAAQRNEPGADLTDGRPLSLRKSAIVL